MIPARSPIRRLHEQAGAAFRAIDERTAALASVRQESKRPGRRVVLTAIGLTVAGAGVALATNGGLRDQVVGSAKALGDEIAGRDE